MSAKLLVLPESPIHMRELNAEQDTLGGLHTVVNGLLNYVGHRVVLGQGVEPGLKHHLTKRTSRRRRLSCNEVRSCSAS
jgi:hypothetical protein